MSSTLARVSTFVAKPHYVGDPSKISYEQDGCAVKIKPQGLNIVWGGTDKRYWKIPDSGPAVLIQVSWLEVTARIPLSKLDPEKKYKVSFDVSLKADAFGWNEIPIHIMAKIGRRGKYKWQPHVLGVPTNPPFKIPLSLDEPIQITKDEKNSGDSLYFGLYEVWRGTWKGGLQVEEARVEVVPLSCN
ncbi:hypothetical protein AQUCO_03300111v1 [Aquilegia coerulea]|uniref:Uncharacterized protein n=1 Tax=Aquilegia coerulea TaxID=218851 RepID=A0A2G5CZI3_AQUCA|nr:hypothetical protein AQUCO_03300111v1 [Aquilegia coerulea]